MMIRLLILVMFAALFISPCYGDLYIVVHQSNPIERIDKDELRALYLSQKRTFSNGEYVKLYSLENQKSKEAFLNNVVKMPLSQFDAYWARLVFSGRVLPINQAKDDEALISMLEKDKNGIGFLSAPPRSNNLKVVQLVSE